MQAIRHLNCPQCGGTLGAHGMERMVRCRYCNTTSVIDSDDLVPEYMVRPKLDQHAARRVVQNLLSDGSVPRGMLKLSRFHSARLNFVPFHEVSARRTGTMIMTVKKEFVSRAPLDRDDQGISATAFMMMQQEAREREHMAAPTKDTKVIMSDVSRLEPAIDLPGWALEEAELSSLRTSADGALLPVNRRRMEKLGTVHHPTMTPQNVINMLQLRAETANLQDNTEFREVRAKRIYYPIWRVRYLYQGRLYGATIDGVTGKVMLARAPQDDRSRVLWLLGMSAAACLLPGKMIGGIMSEISAGAESPLGFLNAAIQVPQLVIPAFILGLAILVVIIGIGWEQFRYPGEIVIKGDTRDVEKLNRPENTSFDRIRDVLLKGVEDVMKHAGRSRRDWP